MRVYRLPALLPLLSLLALLLSVNGCGSPFPPRTLVERLRVLGIQSDPADAEVLVSDTGTDATLKSSINLRALVADPFSGRKYSITWGICLTVISDETSSIDCPDTNSLPLPSDPSQCIFQLPSGECTSQLTQSDLDALRSQQVIDLSTIGSTCASVDVWIGFLVQALDKLTGAQVDEVRAVKRLPAHICRATSTPDETTFNHNPVLLGVNDVTDTTVGLTLGQKTRLKPYIDPDSRERFTPSGETERSEDFVYTWFSNIGQFDYSRTISAANNQNSNLDENSWSIPKTLTKDQKADSYLWLVVRDGRFGTDWKVFTGYFP